MIQINRQALKAVALFQAVKDVRYYLNGVQVECTLKKTRLCAIDGHTLALHQAAAENSEACKSLIIPSDAVKAMLALKMPKGAHSDMPIELTAGDNSEWRAVYFGAVVVFKPIDGKFPDYSRVIPSKLSGVVAQFDGDYMARFMDAARVFNKARYATIAHNGNDSALVDIQEPGFVGVLMPFRGDAPKAESMAWARGVLTDEPANDTKPEESAAAA